MAANMLKLVGAGLLLGSAKAAPSARHAVRDTTDMTIEDAFSKLSSIYDVQSSSLMGEAGSLIAAGLASLQITDVVDYMSDLVSGKASSSNSNTMEPTTTIYPSASDDDAPYSFSEDVLRSAIYIPETFQYGAEGAPQPIILAAGTANPGYVTYSGSWIPLLQNNETSIGDPVWINIPDYSLDDIQGNAEFVAYAINYISGICGGRKVAVFGYSQGNLDSQWAYKYWPSTRDLVTDHVAFSPGYRGTKLTELIALIPLPPAWLQAAYYSNFVTAMLADDGDSAWVPTTIIYSSTDQVVQPQTGDGASSPLSDVRGVGVLNALVQDVCPSQPAGGFFTHELIMVNSLAYYLAKDALANDGPANLTRVDLDVACGSYMAPSLELEDFMLTENTLVVAAVETLAYIDKSYTEPAIKGELNSERAAGP